MAHSFHLWSAFLLFCVFIAVHRNKEVHNCTHIPQCLLVFAFYYPQFHPIPENRIEGFPDNFTEWDLIKTAADVNRYGAPIKKPITAPSYLYPNMGYYDLLQMDSRCQQGKLAQKFGVDGFFIYHYWLNNRVVMGKVIEHIISDGEPGVPFAFCWVNEDWENFYGLRRPEVLQQHYDAPGLHGTYLSRIFQAPNYLHINGRPALAIYIPSEVSQDYLGSLRKVVAKAIGKDIFLIACVQTYKHSGNPYTVLPGYDAIMEFSPNIWMSANKFWDPKFPFFECNEMGRHSYHPWFVDHNVTTVPVWRGGLSGWDPTPRYPNSIAPKRDTEDCDFSPLLFQDVTNRRIYQATCESGGMPSMYLIFAWNEWGEGAVLEPNTATGNALLEGLAYAKAHGHQMFCGEAKEHHCTLIHQELYHFTIHGGRTSILPPQCMSVH